MTTHQPTPGVNESIVEKIATSESTTALSGEPWRSALQQAADLAEARAEELLDRWTSDLGATIETKAAGAASYIIAGLHGDILALLIKCERQTPPESHVRTVTEIPMTAFADAAPQRDEFKHEQTILTYNDKVGVWDLSFFESGEEFPEKWFGDTHWIDITGMWPGVIAQVASFATTEGSADA